MATVIRNPVLIGYLAEFGLTPEQVRVASAIEKTTPYDLASLGTFTVHLPAPTPVPEGSR